MSQRQNDAHGNRCSCRMLAEAVGCRTTTIGFSYCQMVLMKRWAMECNHGCQDAPARPEQGGKWHDIGPIDPIKAILIRNE